MAHNYDPYHCPVCDWWHFNAPDPIELCGTCGLPVCGNCEATCELCNGPMHQQIAALGNHQCMYAFVDKDVETGASSVLLVCGKCYTPDARTRHLWEQESAASRREADALADFYRRVG